MAEIKHIDIVVTGRVQGVCYRDCARREAARLGINGFVRNQADGSVYIEAEGPGPALDAFLGWCRQGSAWAVVENVTTEEAQSRGYREFQVRY